MLRQGLAAGAFPCGTGLLAGRRVGGLFRFALVQFGRRGGKVGGQSFLEQVALLDGEGVALGAEAHPAQMGQFQDEGLNLGLRGVEFGVATGDLLDQPKGFGGVFLGGTEQCLS